MVSPEPPEPKAVLDTASRAMLAFTANARDVRNYYHIHQELKGRKGAKRQLVTFDKSMFVLVAALWESYCEDVIAEALEVIAGSAPKPEALPLPLRKLIAQDLRKDPHELAVWRLADDGWRQLVESRLEKFRGPREWLFNSPKSSSVDDLFRRSLGIESISESWSHGDSSADAVREQLDEYVATRGAIAHRSEAGKPLAKLDVKKFFNLVQKIVELTDRAVAELVQESTGLGGWATVPTTPEPRSVICRRAGQDPPPALAADARA